jgi:polyhydroxyalkanoate synthesis regulator phasin
MISTKSSMDPVNPAKIISTNSQTEDEWNIEHCRSETTIFEQSDNISLVTAIESLKEEIVKLKVETIEAASSRAESYINDVDLTLGNAITKSFESNISYMNTVTESITTLKEEMVKHDVETKKYVTNLKEQMVKLNVESKKNMKEMIEINKVESKKRNLECAMANADLFSFNFYMDSSLIFCNSSKIVKEILIRFRRGDSCTIHNCYLDKNCNEESNIAFRELLQDQIFDLTGMKPRIENVSKNDSKDDIFEIHYC